MRFDAPPGGWKFFQKETRLMILGDGPDNLLDLVVAHRKYKNLEPTDREAVWLEIERQLCTRLTKRDCKAEGPNDDWVPMRDEPVHVDYSMIVGFSRAALEWIASGREVVPELEARRRAEICFTCPLNQRSEGCLPCSVLYKMIRSSIPEGRSIEGLEVCRACSCDLRSKVNLPMNVIRESNRDRELVFPSFCWQAEQPQKSLQ